VEASKERTGFDHSMRRSVLNTPVSESFDIEGVNHLAPKQAANVVSVYSFILIRIPTRSLRQECP
jgi:hypothetical protein